MTSFLSATLLPAQSEILLAGMHLAGKHSTALLVTVATSGNVLGAAINWLLGRYLVHFQERRWFPIRRKSLERAGDVYRKYGIWTLLLAWLPFIGDPLTMVAGIFRVSFLPFVALVTIGKALRYIGVISII